MINFSLPWAFYNTVLFLKEEFLTKVEGCYFNWLPWDCLCGFLSWVALETWKWPKKGWKEFTRLAGCHLSYCRTDMKFLYCPCSLSLPQERPWPDIAGLWLFSGPWSQCDSSLKEQMVELVKKASSSSSSWPRCQNEITKDFLLGCNWTWLERCHISKAQACQRLIKRCLCL